MYPSNGDFSQYPSLTSCPRPTTSLTLSMARTKLSLMKRLTLLDLPLKMMQYERQLSNRLNRKSSLSISKSLHSFEDGIHNFQLKMEKMTFTIFVRITSSSTNPSNTDAQGVSGLWPSVFFNLKASDNFQWASNLIILVMQQKCIIFIFNNSIKEAKNANN